MSAWDPGGTQPLFMPPDVDAARRFFRSKPRRMENKVMSVREAVGRYVQDGCYVAVGGFGTNRIPTALLHEIVRQDRRGLGLGMMAIGGFGVALTLVTLVVPVSPRRRASD